jgi:hypothetical protein
MSLSSRVKGSTSITEYFYKICALANDMTYAGKKLNDDEITDYILADLDVQYNPIIGGLTIRVESINLGNLYILAIAWF